MASVPPISTPLSPARPAARVDDARAAFFRQALGQAPVPAAAPAPAAPAQARIVAQATPAPAPVLDPDRPVRPGSIIDIRV